jgi:predicted phosphodiesterase
MNLWFVLALLLCVVEAGADSGALVRAGDWWRFLPGTNNPSETIGAWKELVFDDSNWLTGPCRIGVNGAAFQDATVLSQNVPSVFLRKQFQVQDTNTIAWLVLRVDYQDGFVAYLNGREIVRRGLSGDPVPLNARADGSHPGGAAEELDVTAFKSLLNNGSNTIAIECHQASDYRLSIFAELVANFTRGPYVQGTSSNSTRIVWKTLMAADSTVEYAENGASGNSDLQIIHSDTLTNLHVVRLENLRPDTRYNYRVISGADTNRAASDTNTFHTFKESGGVRFAVIGDCGSGSMEQYRMAAVLRSLNVDLVVVVGDVVYPQFTAGRVDARCFSVYQPQMSNVPFFVLPGNHDRYASPVDLFQAFYPENPAGFPDGLFYSFDAGDAHFAMLDTDVGAGIKLGPGSPQYQWLENDLQNTSKPWKFIFGHNPWWSSGPHQWDDYNVNGIRDEAEFRDGVAALAMRNGAQIAFFGHEHTYERLGPVQGLHSIITGGGGAYLYAESTRNPQSAQYIMEHQCVVASLEGDSLQTCAIGMNGELLDAMSIGRAALARELIQAEWHSPDLNMPQTNDGDVNLNNQVFRAIGAGITSVAGQSANLGRLFVNNDDAMLYLGIDRAMIHDDQNIYLFIETPGLEGVAGMAVVGNGQLDPQGQGADGLDALKNLSFTNFHPAVACILGDESADGPARDFTRPGAQFSTGQGVFYLNRTLDDFPVFQLQQFNRNPQQVPVPGEQNADYMEIALPLESLGFAKPGDMIKVGVVAAQASLITNSANLMQRIDTGFLGYSLTNTGQNSQALEGLQLQLAVPADADMDGLHDDWEARYGLDTRSGLGDDGPDGDPDKDGMTNLQEQLAGTDPLDAQSTLRLVCGRLDNGAVWLTWPAVAGRKYVLEFSDSLIPDFVQLSPAKFPLRAQHTGLLSHVDAPLEGTRLASRYYRVRVMK